MNLTHKNLRYCFFGALLWTLFHPFNLMLLPAFIVISIYQRPLINCLWYACLCGLLIDLLQSDMRFGLHALAYTGATLLLYKQKRNFFADHLTTLPVMTFFFTAATSAAVGFFVKFTGKEILLSWQWIATDLLLLPFFDGVLAFCCYVLPFFLMGNKPRKGEDYFAKN